MIEILDLHHRYPDGTHTLKGINLTILKGEFVLICGPNGSGKTTLTRVMGGLLEPTGGHVCINGLDTMKKSREVRRLVGMVFQDPESQIVGETVGEDLAFGPENMGLSTEKVSQRVEHALKVMGLEGLSEKPCYLLSGGEKRRLAIAGVLAMDPEIVLFDEPFSYLDYPGTREVLYHMVRLHHEGRTLVVTTHDVEKVIAHVNRIVVIQGGELKADGPPEALVAELARFDVRPPCSTRLGQERISWLND